MSERLGQPAGIPIGRALIVAPGIANDDLREVVATINRVHGDGVLPAIPLAFSERLATLSGRSLDGYFSSTLDKDGTALARSILVRASAPHRQFVAVHEIGHFLDACGFPGTGYASQRPGPLDRWRRSVFQSQVFEMWEHLAATSGAEIADQAAACLDPSELWARSYAQFIAIRADHPPLRRGLIALRRRRAENGVYFPRQWADDDFAEIEAAVEALFETHGWMT